MRAVPLALLALAVAAAAALADARPQVAASLAEEDAPQGSEAVAESQEERVKRWADPRGGGIRPGPRPPYRPRPRPPNPVPFPRGRRSLSEKDEVHQDVQNEVKQEEVEERWKRSVDPRGGGIRPGPRPPYRPRPRPPSPVPFPRGRRSLSEQEGEVHHDEQNEVMQEGRWKRSPDPRGNGGRPKPSPKPGVYIRPRPLPLPPFARRQRSVSGQEDDVHHDVRPEELEGRLKRSADPRGGGARPRPKPAPRPLPKPRPPHRPRPRPPSPVPFPRGRRSLLAHDEDEVMQEERWKRSADPRGNGVRPNKRRPRPHPNQRPRPPRPDRPNLRPARSLSALQHEARWKRSPDPRRPRPQVRITTKPKTPAQPKRPRPSYPSPRPGFVNRPGRSLLEQEVDDFVMHELKQETQEGRWKRSADPRGGGARPRPRPRPKPAPRPLPKPRPPHRPLPRPPSPVPFPRGRRSLSEQEGEVHHDEQNEVMQEEVEERWKRSADPRECRIRRGPRPPYRPSPRPPSPVPFPRGRRSLSEQDEVHQDVQNEVKQEEVGERWKRSADPRGGGIRPGPRPPYRPRPRPPSPVPFPRGRRSLSEQDEVHQDVQNEVKQEEVEERWKRSADPRGGGIRPGPRPPYRPRPRPPSPVPFPRGRRSLSEQDEVHQDVQNEVKQEEVEGRWKRTPDNMPAPLPPPIIPHSAGPDPANPRSPPPGPYPRGR